MARALRALGGRHEREPCERWVPGKSESIVLEVDDVVSVRERLVSGKPLSRWLRAARPDGAPELWLHGRAITRVEIELKPDPSPDVAEKQASDESRRAWREAHGKTGGEYEDKPSTDLGLD